MEEKVKFYKLYEKVLVSKKLDLEEAVLLCLYLNKYVMFGEVYASDSSDAKYIKIDRHYVGNKRKHLEEIGYIKCEGRQGKKTKITIDPKLIKLLGIKKIENDTVN